MENAGLVWVYMFSSLTIIVLCFFLIVGSDKPSDQDVKPVFSAILAVIACLGIYIIWTYIFPIIGAHLRDK